VDGVGEADDGVDGADAEGGVGFEVEDAGDVLEGSGEGEVGFGGFVLSVGAPDGVVPGLDVGLVEPEEGFEGVFFAEGGEGNGVAAGAEEGGELGAVFGGEARGGGEHGTKIRHLIALVNTKNRICSALS
jgi:hypothetical protein